MWYAAAFFGGLIVGAVGVNVGIIMAFSRAEMK